MNVLVLLAGVLDPKWPLDPGNQELTKRTADRLILSPFDEAALEIALSLRDTAAATTLRAVVMGGREAERLARSVAALNVAVATLEIADWWDQNVVAEALGAVSNETELILIGREFGDCDDGVVPALLAARLGRPHFACAQAVRDRRVMRESTSAEEWLTLDRALVVSVTNDRRNRLRKPLMKNVMIARQAIIDSLAPAEVTSCATLAAARTLASCRNAVECPFIDGPPDRQARRLAEMLS